MMDGIELGILKPVTEEGKKTLKNYVDHFEEMNRKKCTPVTTLTPTAAGGKRNKSKKPKRRNSRSKRRKTVSKRRR